MRALLAAYFNRIDLGLPIHYFGNEHHALIKIYFKGRNFDKFHEFGVSHEMEQ